jgi:trehalose synthase
VSLARLDAYADVAPRGTIDLLLQLAERVKGRRLLHVSPSRFGAGSAEILHRAIPLLRDLGVQTEWEVIVGNPEFYAAVARLEQSLAGVNGLVTAATLGAWEEAAGHNAAALPLGADVVMVHDLAPVPLVRHRPPGGRWVWRCHGDLSQAYRRTWHLLRPDLERYDAAIFSLPKFSPRLPIPTLIVHPSIDPLSEKNRELPRSEVGRILDSLRIPRDKPLLLQVAPYARSTDPAAVVHAYRLARKYVDCRLVVAGWGATDNPEGEDVLAEVRTAAFGNPDVHVLVLPADAALEINALQRAAAVVIHLPRHEDFGLGVAEAMWKGKPVIGTLAGGIPAQVIPETTGFIVTSIEGAAFRIRQLLENPEMIARLGGAAREYVRRTFLITRHLGDYLAVLASLTE